MRNCNKSPKTCCSAMVREVENPYPGPDHYQKLVIFAVSISSPVLTPSFSEISWVLCSNAAHRKTERQLECQTNQADRITSALERQDQQPPTQQPTRTRSTTSCLTLTCFFLWLSKQGALGTIRRWNWYENLEDGRPASQVTSGSPSSCSSSCPWHYRGGMRSHFKTRS